MAGKPPNPGTPKDKRKAGNPGHKKPGPTPKKGGK